MAVNNNSRLPGPGLDSMRAANVLFDPRRALDDAGGVQLGHALNARNKFLPVMAGNQTTHGHEHSLRCNHAFFKNSAFCIPGRTSNLQVHKKNIDGDKDDTKEDSGKEPQSLKEGVQVDGVRDDKEDRDHFDSKKTAQSLKENGYSKYN